MVGEIANIEFIVTETEAEALLAEQNFIKQYRPLFNVRLRDDKSYPYIAISLDEDFPRVYFTREKHRRDRAYFGPFSNAKRVRETLDLLGKVFQYRTCDGRGAGPRVGQPVPRLLHQALRGALRRLRVRRRSTASRSTRSSTSSPAATARSSATSRSEMKRRVGGAGVRAGGRAPQPAEGGAQPARAPADLERGGRHARRDRGRGRGHRRERAGLPGARRRAGRPPELLPREPGRPRRGRGGRGVRAPVLRHARRRSRRR